MYRSSPSEAKETRRPGGRYRTREGLPNRAALFLCAGNEKAARLRRAATDHGFEKRADPQLDFTRQHAQLGQEAAKLGFLGLGGIREHSSSMTSGSCPCRRTRAAAAIVRRSSKRQRLCIASALDPCGTTRVSGSSPARVQDQGDGGFGGDLIGDSRRSSLPRLSGGAKACFGRLSGSLGRAVCDHHGLRFWPGQPQAPITARIWGSWRVPRC